MSEAVAETGAKAPAAAGGSKKLLFIVLGVNLLLAAGLGYVMLGNEHQAAGAGRKAEAHESGEAEAEGEDDGKKDAKHGKFGPLLDVGTFIANVASGPGQPARYCKVSVYAEAKSEETKAVVAAAAVPIKSEALLMLSNLKPDELIGQEKLSALSNQLLKRANRLIGKNAIKHIYFAELVVQ